MHTPTAEEKIFCSSSSAQGVVVSLSLRMLEGNMPKNCTGSHSGQLHCLVISNSQFQYPADDFIR